MKIVINAFQYSDSITGTDRMAHNFLRELQNIDTQNKYFIICSRVDYNKFIIDQNNFSIISPREVPLSLFLRRLYDKLWRTVMPFRVLLLRPDTYLSFHNMSLPFFRVAPRMIAFNLDLIPLKYPEYAAILHENQQTIFDRYLKVSGAADHIVSISEFSKSELCDLLGVSTGKVSVIQLAADQDLKTSTGNKTGYNVPNNYILTIGGSEPRKNVETIFKAFSQLPTKLQKEFPLYIVGGIWHGRSLEKFSDNPYVTCLGYVPDKELPILYRQASVFIFASEYEGFGFTILEAMSLGVPVISARGSSLSEVAGNSAVLFNPHNSDELSGCLRQVLDSEPKRQRLIADGYNQASNFSWRKSTQKLHKLLTQPLS